MSADDLKYSEIMKDYGWYGSLRAFAQDFGITVPEAEKMNGHEFMFDREYVSQENKAKRSIQK